MTSTSDSAYTGSMDRSVAGSDYATIDFIARRVLGRAATNSLVEVVSVQAGEGGLIGFVDVRPMVHQIDGANNAWPHGVISHVPYFRLQGGANAMIIDPAVGDRGIAVFAAEDISTVIQSKAPAPPGSRRRFSMGDAMYLGGLGWLNGTPQQYIRMDATGITVQAAAGLPIRLVSDTGVTIDSPTTTFIGDIATAAGSMFNGKSFDSHTHSGVQTGSGTSGPPE